jgi:hypothetical protein
MAKLKTTLKEAERKNKTARRMLAEVVRWS